MDWHTIFNSTSLIGLLFVVIGGLAIGKGLGGVYNKSAIDAYNANSLAQANTIAALRKDIDVLTSRMALMQSDSELLHMGQEAAQRSEQGLREVIHVLIPVMTTIPSPQREMIEGIIKRTEDDVAYLRASILDIRINRGTLRSIVDRFDDDVRAPGGGTTHDRNHC